MEDFNPSELKELQREFRYREFARQADVAHSVAAQSKVPSIYQKTDEELWKNGDLNRKILASLDALEFTLKNKDVDLDTYSNHKAEIGRIVFSEGWKEAATLAKDQYTGIKLLTANHHPYEIADSLNKNSLYITREKIADPLYGERVMGDVLYGIKHNDKLQQWIGETTPSHSNPVRLDKLGIATPLLGSRVYKGSSYLMMMGILKEAMDAGYEPIISNGNNGMGMGGGGKIDPQAPSRDEFLR